MVAKLGWDEEPKVVFIFRCHYFMRAGNGGNILPLFISHQSSLLLDTYIFYEHLMGISMKFRGYVRDISAIFPGTSIASRSIYLIYLYL